MKILLNRILNKAIRSFVNLLSKVQSGLSQSIIDELNREHGRGFGTRTVEIEVETIFNLIGNKAFDSGIVLDVGANIGEYADAVLSRFPKYRVFCFEPSSRTSQFLKEKYSRESRVQVVPVALGRESGAGTLFFDNELSGLSSMTKRRLDHFGIEMKYKETIQIIELDKWCEENQIFPDIVKIDVEGHELDVLIGGLSCLSKTKAIQFEFGGCNIDTRTYFQDFWYFFSARNFKLFRITPRGPEEIRSYSEDDEYFRTTNFIAVNSNLI